jgi:TolB-like protein/Tfp pilus assembly protein PilF
MSLYNELKRRNVFRVAAAYVVIGWLILQVAEIVLGFIGAPEWVGKALIALLLLGFVPVLAIAWVFEVGPEGIRRDDGSNARDASPQARRLDVITLGAVVLVVILLAWQHLGTALQGPQQATSAGDAPPAAAVPAQPAPEQAKRPRLEPPPFEPLPGSIAVLPFTNRSAEPDTAYFVDGVHDDLLTQLARNGDLRVISRTSMMEYRDTTKNVRQIGEELGVATILEGAVQRAGQRVRINAQLIDTQTDAHLWAETFDRELTPENVFEIQSDIAAAIAAALGSALGAGEPASPGPAVPTRSAEAYDLFLRARATREVWAESEVRARMALYRRALEYDENFVLAMAELGREYTNIFWHHSRRDEDRREGGRWIDRALALEPDNPEVRLARAEFLYRAYLDYEGALEELDRAAIGLPGSAEMVALRGFILRRAGRVQEMVETMQSAALLAPRSEQILATLIENAWLVGDVDEVKRWHTRLEAVQGDVTAQGLAWYPRFRLQVLGDPAPLERFVATSGRDLPDSQARYQEGLLYYLSGDYASVERLLGDDGEKWFEDQFELVPTELMRARLSWAKGNSVESTAHAKMALSTLDAVLAQHPDDYRALMARAEVLALLGEAEAAREAARQALAQRIPSRDLVIRSELNRQQLVVTGLLDSPEAVAAATEAYLQLEMKYWGFDGLMLHPVFKQHRDHPTFQALATKYSRKGSGS